MKKREKILSWVMFGISTGALVLNVAAYVLNVIRLIKDHK